MYIQISKNSLTAQYVRITVQQNCSYKRDRDRAIAQVIYNVYIYIQNFDIKINKSKIAQIKKYEIESHYEIRMRMNEMLKLKITSK